MIMMLDDLADSYIVACRWGDCPYAQRVFEAVLVSGRTSTAPFTDQYWSAQ